MTSFYQLRAPLRSVVNMAPSENIRPVALRLRQTKGARLKPLDIEEYESKFRESATDLQLIERVFQGSISCNQLRTALWPYLFGLTSCRGRFEKFERSDPSNNNNNNSNNNTTNKRETFYLYKEHKDNLTRWEELEKLYYLYEAQWRAITPDQETRFTTFRERKSTIERDVIRCDRLHPFYATQNNENLDTLNKLLMTYMMYDFDIGYVQGMSDLAAPILYMYDGNLVKSFWIFVEAMKLFRRNFVPHNVDFQLSCLFRLIEETDSSFARYLERHESSNCFFAFRAIVCQFKRELMKTDEDDYSKVLHLWDTIWSVKRRLTLQEEVKASNGLDRVEDEDDDEYDVGRGTTLRADVLSSNYNGKTQFNGNSTGTKTIPKPGRATKGITFSQQCDLNETETQKANNLRETEMFVLALCLSMINREKEEIMAKQLDGTDIHQHFSNPELTNDFDDFIEGAINIYSKMKTELDINKMMAPKREPVNPQEVDSPFGSAEGYVLISPKDWFLNGIPDR